MQEHNAENCSVPERLERFRVRTQMTWAQVAKRIGLSTSMIYQVKRGDVALSSKALYRLRHAELEAGVVSGADFIDESFNSMMAQPQPFNGKGRLREAAVRAREFADRATAHAEELERLADLEESVSRKGEA